MQTELRRRLERQREFLIEGRGHLLVFAYCPLDPCPAPYSIPGQATVLSEAFLKRHAYLLGIQRIRAVKAQVRGQLGIPDDSVPAPGYGGLTVDWGTGATAALFTGGDVVFQEITSYSAKPLIRTWDDLDRLVLSTENRWFDYELQFWRGVLSECEDDLPVATHNYRSPLDYAIDFRGNELFADLYEHPAEVERLVALCAEAVIACDRRIREELPDLARLPGGAWGVALPEPGMIFLNGDPVDLVSEAHGERFSTPYVERIAAYAGSLYFHHHSIGATRARSVSNIKGLTVQEILQDPNGPRLVDCIDDDLIEASLRVPIDLGLAINRQAADLDALLESLRRGRFIVRVAAETRAEATEWVEKVRHSSQGA